MGPALSSLIRQAVAASSGSENISSARLTTMSKARRAPCRRRAAAKSVGINSQLGRSASRSTVLVSRSQKSRKSVTRMPASLQCSSRAPAGRGGRRSRPRPSLAPRRQPRSASASGSLPDAQRAVAARGAFARHAHKRYRREMLLLPGLDQGGDPRRLGAVAEDDDPPLRRVRWPKVTTNVARVRVMQPSQIKAAQRQIADVRQMLQPGAPILDRDRDEHQHKHKGNRDPADQQPEIDEGLFPVETDRDHRGDRCHRQTGRELGGKVDTPKTISVVSSA